MSAAAAPARTVDEELLCRCLPLLPEQDPARLRRIQAELAAGFEALADVDKAVSIFGSARTPPGHPEYELARTVARRLGEAGFAILTGGGPGIMAAANRGARDARALSVGLNIELPREQGTNEWVELGLEFHYFFARKLMFVRYASRVRRLPRRLRHARRALRGADPDPDRQDSRTFRSSWPGPSPGRDSSTGCESGCSRRARSRTDDLELLRASDDVDEICALVEEGYRRQREASGSVEPDGR